MTRILRSLLVVVTTAMAVVFGLSPAQAADGDAAITHVSSTDQGLQILVSVPEGAQVDLGDVAVTIAGKDAEATAQLASDDTKIKRTTVLAIDTSNSMKGDRFDAAVAAANIFLDTAPADVYVGITTFAGDVQQVLPPTLDRDAARNVIAGLTLSKQTHLYDGVIAAAQMAGRDGQRAILVLSDGADTTKTPLETVTKAVTDGELLVDVVALDQNGKALRSLETLADSGNGKVIQSDPAALSEAFSSEADALSRQVLVTATMPSGIKDTEGNVEVTLATSSGDLTATAFAPLAAKAEAPADPTAALKSGASFLTLGNWAMWAGLAAITVGLVFMFVNLVPAKQKVDLAPEERVTKYTQAVSAGMHSGSVVEAQEREAALESAKNAAALMLRRNKSLEARIAGRLEAAGSDLKSAEWLLLHASIAVTAGLVGVLLTKSFLVSAVFALFGVVVPWFYLGFKRGRRLKAFNQSLPDTLQLMAGSLQAGLSLAQSVDTIVREGREPIAGEFKRVLVEARLGVSLEDALEGITERFESKDFAWVVMAIKIQRQVGGNLAELLNTVAGTIREREYMRRQVNALAAEGKLSAYVIGGLPPGFLIYLLIINRPYVMPMFTEPMGWVLLTGAGILLSVGLFWMSRVIKVEV
ncbi:MAG: type II secretion system F family protein [Nocardioidaceae bacterium]